MATLVFVLHEWGQNKGFEETERKETLTSFGETHESMK